MYTQDFFTAVRQEILDLRLHKTPRHVLNDLIEILDLHRWLTSEKIKNINYSELLSTLMMYTGNECIGCIGFFATFPLIHPDQVYLNSTTIRAIGVVVKDQIIKWDHLTGYMTLKGTETLPLAPVVMKHLVKLFVPAILCNLFLPMILSSLMCSLCMAILMLSKCLILSGAL